MKNRHEKTKSQTNRHGYTQCPDGLWRKRADYSDGSHEVLVRNDSGRLMVDRVSDWPDTEPQQFSDN